MQLQLIIINNVLYIFVLTIFSFLVSVQMLDDGLKNARTLISLALTTMLVFTLIYSCYMNFERQEQVHLLQCINETDEYANVVNVRENVSIENGVAQTSSIEFVYYILYEDEHITFKRLCELGYTIRPKNNRRVLWFDPLYTTSNEIIRAHDSFEQITFDIIPKDEN